MFYNVVVLQEEIDIPMRVYVSRRKERNAKRGDACDAELASR